MNIVWLNHRDMRHPRAGGAERAIQEISKYLVDQGDNVTIVSCKYRGSKNTEIMDGIRILRMGNPLTVHFRSFLWILGKSGNFIVVDSLGHVVPWFSELSHSGPGLIFFFHLHSRTLPGQVSRPVMFILSAIERSYKHVYKEWKFVTESKQSELDLQSIGINPERIERIPLGVDLQLFKPAEKTSYPSVVYYGGLRKYKRAEEAIFLAKHLVGVFPGIRLRIVGDGPTKRDLITLTREMHLESCVSFLGKVDDNTLSKIVAESWLNIHCSVAEGWGLSVLESSAAGTPTVAYSVPGVSEIISVGINGITVEDSNREGLLRAACHILKDPLSWTKGCREVAEKYSWKFVGNSWRNLLTQVQEDRQVMKR